MIETGYWRGSIPPQYLFAHRAFLGIALEPPDREPGSWIGAGKAFFDPLGDQFILTARPRKAEGGVRGYAANIYRSANGLHFDHIGGVTTAEAASLSGLQIHSIEGTQLLRDPLTDRWLFFLSVDTGESFVWGGINWETLLLTAPALEGPWESRGIVLARDREWDRFQARDSSIDIIDGLWVCLYKAMNDKREVRPALATSLDGVEWRKQGLLTVDGEDHLGFLSGSFVEGIGGPVFLGLDSSLQDSRQKNDEVVYADEHGIGHGSSATHCAGYLLDRGRLNLETIYRSYWEPGSRYEHPTYPLLGYSSVVYDPKGLRMLFYVEAIDAELTKRIGLNETVERVLVYETDLRRFSL